MRTKTILAAILASSMLASPAMARDDSWYVEADFGGLWVPETDFDIGVTADAARVRFQRGWEGAGVIGYDFGPFRLEAEGSYRWNKANQITANINIPGQTALGGASPFIGTTVEGNTFVTDLQHSKVWGGMVNGLIDLGPDDGLQGYVGGGAGYMTVEHSISANRLGPGWLNDQSNGGFAWQGLVGVRYPISNSIDVGLKYRFLNVGNVDMVESSGRAVQSRWRSHSALLTLGYNFGSAPPPPPAPVIAPPPAPPPPAPPPPPPPPPPVCEKGPYIVFFDWDSSDITPEAAAILDSAVAAYGNCANTRVMLAGHADRSGSTEYNVGLSQRRNASVTAYLGSRGIPAGSISGEGFGEGANRVPTADGVRELQNRRVEITYGPGSGM